MDKKIVIFAYNFPHKKTQDFLLRMNLYNIRPALMLISPPKKLNLPETFLKDKYKSIGLLHPRDICRMMDVPCEEIDHNDSRVPMIIKYHNIELGLIAGARIFFVLEYHEQFFSPDKNLIQSFLAIINIPAGGLVVFGALPTASLAAWLFSRRRNISITQLADCIAPGLLIGLSLGRLGCFLNGCCYGGPCELPWAMQFPAGISFETKELICLKPTGPRSRLGSG